MNELSNTELGLSDPERHLLSLAIVTFGYRNREKMNDMVIIAGKLGLHESVDEIDADQVLKAIEEGKKK